jgi:hypothetical protein
MTLRSRVTGEEMSTSRCMSFSAGEHGLCDPMKLPGFEGDPPSGSGPYEIALGTSSVLVVQVTRRGLSPPWFSRPRTWKAAISSSTPNTTA